MALTINKSVLYRTCDRDTVQSSGGEINIAGLFAVSRRDLVSIQQIKSRAEVAQVRTVGATAYVPTAGTVYQVEVYDPNRTQAGYTESPKVYKYRTADTITGVAATDRETIHAALVAAINLDRSNHAVAASLGSGNGFTVTDDGSYYPVFSQNMSNVKGINTVRPLVNKDGTGFAETNVTTTTAGVYSFGIGAKLLQEAPTVDFVYGNLISGRLTAPPLTVPAAGAQALPAVSGQNYDGFVFSSLKLIPVAGVGGQLAYEEVYQICYADNGTGTSTSNLTGFKAFEREMHKLMVSVYSNDLQTLQEWFDNLICFQDPFGVAPTGTADTLGWQMSPYTGMYRINIGTQTVLTPVLNDLGLLLDQDDTATEGSHTCASIRTIGAQQAVVGETAFMVGCRVVAGDWTDVQFLFGLRIKAAYAADYNNYTDLAAIGGGAADGDSIFTHGILNNAATVATDTGVNFADAVSVMMWIKVDISGNVTCWVNGTKYPIYSVGTTPLVFDAGDAMIPFYQVVNIGSGDPATVISELFFVPTDTLIS